MSKNQMNSLNADELQSVCGGYTSITQRVASLDMLLKTGNRQSYFAQLRQTVEILDSALPTFPGGIKWPVNGPDPSPMS